MRRAWRAWAERPPRLGFPEYLPLNLDKLTLLNPMFDNAGSCRAYYVTSTPWAGLSVPLQQQRSACP